MTPHAINSYAQRKYFEIILIVVLCVVLVSSVAFRTNDTTQYVVVLMALVGTIPVVVGAIKNLLHGEWASMDMLASAALVFSLWDHEWVSAVFIALMLAAARLLGTLTESRTEKSIASLLKLRPRSAKVVRGTRVEEVPTEQLVVGDIVAVDTGDRIPTDGVVIAGLAAVDESSLTGESLPVDKELGVQVFSATLVSSGSLRIKTEKIGKDTTLEKIIELVQSARSHRSKIHTMGERFGKIYLISIFVLAGVLLYATHNTSLVLAVVLVVCADDIAVAVPLAFLSAIGSLAKRGVVVKGGVYLEALARAKIFVFDKTGTLTKGAVAVSGIYPAPGHTEDELLKYSAIGSQISKHPLSRAIVSYATQHGIEELFPETSSTVGGKGVVATYQGEQIIIGRLAFIASKGIPIPAEVQDEVNRLGDEGQSVSITALNNAIVGTIALNDEIKSEASTAIESLRAQGATRIIMLTGDNTHVAGRVAQKLGITEFYAELLPEGKLARIDEFKHGGDVVMVGDGVNDAAALGAATVGIAMGAIGYDTAIESAHVVLMNDNLLRLSETIAAARRVQRIAVEDFWIWGVSNALGLGLVFLGFIGPPGAAAYNFISDFFPLGNSLRAWSKPKTSL